MILLLDDERSWLNPTGNHVTARTVQEAIDIVDNLDTLDELWLDYILKFEETTEFAKYLAARARENRPLNVKIAYFHSDAFSAKHLLEIYLAPAGITLELVDMYTRKNILK